jgi:type IV pilus assembly protein PilW
MSFARRPRSCPAGQRGLTLVELTVSLALGLLLVGAASLTYLQTAESTRAGALESQMNEDGALALELLQTQLGLAGYSSTDSSGRRAFTGLPVWGCERGFTSTDAVFGAAACRNGASDPRDDTIAVSYEATLFNSQPIGSSSSAPGNCRNDGIAVSAHGVIVADNRFFVASDVDGSPALFCRGSIGAGFTGRAALVPNVERLRLRYAITRATTVGQPAPHQVTSLVDAGALTTADDWARVAAVQICLVVRSARPVPPGGLPMDVLTRHVDCDDTVRTATDGHLRRSYRALIALPNARPALPRPYMTNAGVAVNPYAYLTE